QPGRARDGAAVDRADGGQRPAVRMPGAVPEVEDAVVPERLGGGGEATLPGLGPGRSGFEGEGGCHSDTPLSVHGREVRAAGPSLDPWGLPGKGGGGVPGGAG